MKFLHSMIRVVDLDASLHFYCDLLGLKLINRRDFENGRFSLVFLATDEHPDTPALELTYNWDQTEPYDNGRNFGHLAYQVDDIYKLCDSLIENGITILRPPKEGHMAFIKCPDGISIELLQKGDDLPITEPWASMPNTGSW
ncbi:lactoylglutathione lyase [Marinicellulosiphila megalodicopiae]|uniref:lactoylglutathione lyase n=1 Tax=Marinicellulosiphila megalodicopiae TaxID=2724896 RepID=UPI003BB1E699